MKMTIHDIKARVEAKESRFFDSPTMRYFGQRMSDFTVRKLEDGKYRISAPINDQDGAIGVTTERIFDPETDELSQPE
jgi:hypothetical protein